MITPETIGEKARTNFHENARGVGTGRSRRGFCEKYMQRKEKQAEKQIGTKAKK